MARQNLPPDPPDPPSTSADDTSKINVTEPPTTLFQGRWRFGDIDLGPLPSVAELIASTTDARTGAPRHRRGVRIAHGALNLDKAERLCRFHAILTGNPDTGSCSTKVWPCDSMQEPYCGTNNLADRRQEAIADLRARPTVHVGTVPFSESKRKAINQAEKRAGATVWHLPMSRPHVVIDEWQTSVSGRAETPEIWVLFGDRPYSTKGVTWAEMTGPDAAALFDICCTVPYVPKVPRRTNCVEEATTPVPAPDAAADIPDAPTTSLVLDPSGFDEDSWDTDDDPDADPNDYLPDPLDLDSDLTPDYTHEWQIEPADYKLRKRRQHDLFGEAADCGRDELGWTEDQVAYARRGWCPRGVYFGFWWSLLEAKVAEDKTHRLAQFATYSSEAPERTGDGFGSDEVSEAAPDRRRGDA